MSRILVLLLIFQFPFLLVAQDTDPEVYDLYNEFLECNSTDYVKALSIMRHIFNDGYSIRPDHKVILLDAMGKKYGELGYYDSAIIVYNLGYSLIPESGDDTEYLKYKIFLDRSIAYRNLADIDRSYNDCVEALNSLNRLEKKDKRYYDEIARVYQNLGNRLIFKKEYQEALFYLKKAIKIKKEYDFKGLAVEYTNLAECYFQTGNQDSCLYYCELTIDQAIKEFGPDHSLVATYMRLYASKLILYNMPDQAYPYLVRAIQLHSVNKNQIYYTIASTYNAMAWYYMYKKDYKNALQYIQECINIFSPDSIDLSPFNNPKVVNETPPPSYMYGLQRKGEIIHDMVIMENADCSFLGEYLDSSRKYTASELEDKIMESGIEANNLALDYMFNMLENLSTQASQLHYLERLKDIFTTSIDLCMKLYNKSNERKYLEQAYGFASNSKSLELLFEKQEKDRITRNAIQDSSYYHLLTMKTQIASMENQIEKEKKQGADSMSIAKLKNELISLRRAYQNGISLFRESSSSTLFDPDFYNPEPLKDLQDKLGRKETIIEFSVSDPNMVVRFIHEFIISSENVFYRRMPLTDSILNHIETVQRGLYAHSSNEVPDDSLFRSLESLYTILIEPVAPYIIDKKVIIIPDEELSWIPFDALVFPGINSDASLPADFLINKYRLSYLNSSRLLPYKQRRMHSRPFLTTIISDYSGYENNSFAALPGAKNEAMEISGIFRSHILNSPSKKEVIRNIEKGDIIHMAMHAEAGIERSQSYILLGTDHNNSDSLHLYDFELGSLSSNARLAVLNACETGSGKYSSGDGIFNMSRSFTLAGIDAVVHSMWEVDDRASLEIMTSFYHNLKRGQDKADALHKARLKYLEQQSPSLTHPVYWAGYQIYGDTQRISFPRWILVCVGIGIIFFLVLLGIYMRKQNMI